jgi:hypothetical protein
MGTVVEGPDLRSDSLDMTAHLARIAVKDLHTLIGDYGDDFEPMDSGAGATWGELALEIEMAAGTVLELVAILRKISANKSEHPCWQRSSL